jgi:GNAT superfamily N-acetyltransferase
LADLRRILGDPQFPALVERLEAAVWLGLAQAQPPARVLQTLTIDGASVIIDLSTDRPVNRVFELGIDRPISQQTLDHIIGAFAAAGVDSFSAGLLPIARPTQAPRLLEQAGFKRGPQQAAVVRPAGGTEEADSFFRIRPAVPADAALVEDLMVRSAGDPPDWARVVSNLLNNESCRLHLAFEGSRAYAMGGFFSLGDMAFLFTRSWILPGFESRGVESAMIQTALRDAEAQGCNWVVSIYPVTAETRMRRFERMGFEVIFQRRVYFYGPESQPNDLGDPLNRSVQR